METLAESVEDSVPDLPQFQKRRQSSRSGLSQLSEEIDDTKSVISSWDPEASSISRIINGHCMVYPCCKHFPTFETDSQQSLSRKSSRSSLTRSSSRLSIKSQKKDFPLNQDTLESVIDQLQSPQFIAQSFQISMSHIQKFIKLLYQGETEALHPILLNDCLVCLKRWFMKGSEAVKIEHGNGNDDGKVAAHLFTRDKLVKHWITQGLEFKILYQIEREVIE